MAWLELGSVAMTYEWQFLPVTATLVKTFRLTHTIGGDSYIKGRISQAFAPEPYNFYGGRRIYPNQNIQVVVLKAPDELENLTEHPRFIALKRTGIVYTNPPPWTVKVESFLVDVSSPNITLETIQGKILETEVGVSVVEEELLRVESKVDQLLNK